MRSPGKTCTARPSALPFRTRKNLRERFGPAYYPLMKPRLGSLALAALCASLVFAPSAQAEPCTIEQIIPVATPATATIVATPAAPEAGQKVVFEATDVTDWSNHWWSEILMVPLEPPMCVEHHDVIPVSAYQWDFGDGSPVAAGKSTEHVFTTAGTRTVTLSLLGEAGFPAGTVTRTVTVSPKPDPVVPVDPVDPVVPVDPDPSLPSDLATPVLPGPETVPPGTPAASKVRAPSAYCTKASRRRPRGARKTPYAQCVAALGKLKSGKTKSATVACKGLARRRVAGMKRTPFAECVSAGRALLADARK